MGARKAGKEKKTARAFRVKVLTCYVGVPLKWANSKKKPAEVERKGGTMGNSTNGKKKAILMARGMSGKRISRHHRHKRGLRGRRRERG